jgi:peptidoglycan/LPS O-acetylase OafA/YrhL
LPRLDGIRALAIGCVLLEHFSTNSMVRELGLGEFGVRSFFVLSGFLITRILIGYRKKGLSVSSAAGQFYWRRLVRLAPAYYLCIGITAFFSIGGVEKTWWIHAIYLSNFQVAIQGHWNGASHF